MVNVQLESMSSYTYHIRNIQLCIWTISVSNMRPYTIHITSPRPSYSMQCPSQAVAVVPGRSKGSSSRSSSRHYAAKSNFSCTRPDSHTIHHTIMVHPFIFVTLDHIILMHSSVSLSTFIKSRWSLLRTSWITPSFIIVLPFNIVLLDFEANTPSDAFVLLKVTARPARLLALRPAIRASYAREYGLLSPAISLATVVHSISLLTFSPRLSCCSSSHFISS